MVTRSYTEPSMEIFGFHPDLNKWTEIGNSGMFRPEMLRPMGIPEDVRVIACGLSLERPTMIKYHCKNIRELFGNEQEQRSSPLLSSDSSLLHTFFCYDYRAMVGVHNCRCRSVQH